MSTSTQHVVMFSGGITSWAAAHRVVDEHGMGAVTLLFADTQAEDHDLYRFLDDAAYQLGVPVTRVADGRDPWQVFRDKRMLGNSRVAPCSRVLKQEPCRAWLEKHTDPVTTVVHVGIDWSEMHRLTAIERAHRPWPVRAPLCEPPYRDKHDLNGDARAAGLEPPRLYRLGFPHNNCGGACVRGGQAQWAHLLRSMPERFAEAERQEHGIRELLNRDVSILTDRTGGDKTPLTLTALRERIEQQEAEQPPFDLFDWGGCGCYTETEEAA